MSLKEDGSAETLYLSQTSFPTKIYMNVYEHHLSFITDPMMYAKSYICNRCGKLSTKMSDNNRHQLKCNGKVKFNLLGGIYKNNPSVFEDMERLGCQNIEEEDKTGKWFACFDFEAYQRDFDDKVDDVEMLQEGTSWNKIHVPMSFSVGCNLEGVETEHRSSKDPSELLSQLVDVLMEMAKKKYEACIERYEHIFTMMDGLLERERSRMESINPRIYSGDDLIKDKKGNIEIMLMPDLSRTVESCLCLGLIQLGMTLN